jgi:Ran GTPase-activating protein (RanGAP) involved in mRNA processing and transport/CRISPR/Cas system-associated exonuclease Cas4 (RecB family)
LLRVPVALRLPASMLRPSSAHPNRRPTAPVKTLSDNSDDSSRLGATLPLPGARPFSESVHNSADRSAITSDERMAATMMYMSAATLGLSLQARKNAMSSPRRKQLSPVKVSGTEDTMPRWSPPRVRAGVLQTWSDDSMRDDRWAKEGSVGILTPALAHNVYSAKCADLSVKPSMSREMRFFDMLDKQSSEGEIKLKDSCVGPLATRTLAQVLSLPQSNQLRHIDLSGNNIRDVGASSVAGLLLVQTQMESLVLACNDIGPTGGETLFRAVASNNTVRILELGSNSGINRNHIGPRCGPALQSLLQNNSCLQALGLSGNGLGAGPMTHIHDGLRRNTSLRTLDLSSNNIGNDGCAVLVQAFESCGLSHVNLARNKIGNAGAAVLAAALQGDLLLQRLNLGENSITGRGANLLADALIVNTTLETIDLCQNALGKSGGVAIGNCLNKNWALGSLNLSHCEIGSEGAAAVFMGLRHNSTLSSLNLSHNSLNDECCVAGQAMLSINSSITSLNLGYNAIKDDGVSNLAKGVAKATALQTFIITSNNFRNVGGAALVAAVRANKTMRLISVDVEFNDVDYTNYTALQRCVAANLAFHRANAVSRFQARVEKLLQCKDKLVVRSHALKTETQSVMQLERAVEEKVTLKEDIKVQEAKKRIESNQIMSDLSDEARYIEKAIVAVGQELHKLESQKLFDIEAAKKKLQNEHDLLQIVQKKLNGAQEELDQRNKRDAAAVSDLVDAISKNRSLMESMQAESSAAKCKIDAVMLENAQLLKELEGTNKQIKALDVKLQQGPLKFGK